MLTGGTQNFSGRPLSIAPFIDISNFASCSLEGGFSPFQRHYARCGAFPPWLPNGNGLRDLATVMKIAGHSENGGGGREERGEREGRWRAVGRTDGRTDGGGGEEA